MTLTDFRPHRVKLIVAALSASAAAAPARAATFTVATRPKLMAAGAPSTAMAKPTSSISRRDTGSLITGLQSRDPTRDINGNGYTLTGNPDASIIEVYTGRTLYLNNIIMSGGDPTQTSRPANRAVALEGTLIADRLTVLYMKDSGIRVTEGAKLTVTNSLFRDNNGPAIAWTAAAKWTSATAVSSTIPLDRSAPSK